MDTGFTNLPRYRQVGAAVLLAAAPLLVGWRACVRPQLREIDESRSALARKQTELSQRRRDRAELARLETRADDLTRRLDGLGPTHAEPQEVSALLRRLQILAFRSNLTIRAFRPQPPVARDLHTAWSFRLTLDGTYPDVAGFFDRVGGLSPVVTIDDVVIRPADAPQPGLTITAECTATAFVRNDPSALGGGEREEPLDLAGGRLAAPLGASEQAER